MQNYQFIGPAPRFYPAIVVPGEGSLIAVPGDVCEFAAGQEPNDGLWAETDEAVTEHGPRIWPLPPGWQEAQPEHADEPADDEDPDTEGQEN